MDPFTHAILGAVIGQSTAKNKNLKVASVAGLLGAIFPDIDVLIRSDSDSLLMLQYHRHFTHSWLMTPVLAFIVAIVLWYFTRKKVPLREIFIYAFLGVISHGLLDACTSYGTQLLWPFSNTRVAWDNIAIIDPLFTFPALVGVIWAGRKKLQKIARYTLGFMLTYLLLGVYQHGAAINAARALASERGHNYVRIQAKPSIGNLVLWRTLYETPEEQFFVDAVHTLPFLKDKIYAGSSVARWKPQSLNPVPAPDSVLAKDIVRFNWFSNYYLFQSHTQPVVISDLRYSTIPNSLSPLWGISVDAQKPDAHVELLNFRMVDEQTKNTFKKMLLRQDL